jgi:hypothetical protein
MGDIGWHSCVMGQKVGKSPRFKENDGRIYIKLVLTKQFRFQVEHSRKQDIFFEVYMLCEVIV